MMDENKRHDMVDLWVVVLGYAFVLLLVQVAVYLYFSNGRSDGGPDRPVPAVGTAEGAQPVDRPADEREYRRCPHCGTANAADGMFSYCRECAGSLRG